MHTYIYTCIQACLGVLCVHSVRICVCLRGDILKSQLTYIYTFIYIYIYMRIYTYSYNCRVNLKYLHKHIQMCTECAQRTPRHTCIYVCVYTHIHITVALTLEKMSTHTYTDAHRVRAENAKAFFFLPFTASSRSAVEEDRCVYMYICIYIYIYMYTHIFNCPSQYVFI